MINLLISQDEFVLVNYVLREYDKKEEIKNFNTFTKQCYFIVSSVEKIQKVKPQKF